jgi:hypothetical protein
LKSYAIICNRWRILLRKHFLKSADTTTWSRCCNNKQQQQQQQKRPQQFQILDHSSKTSSPFFIAVLHKEVLSFFLSFLLCSHCSKIYSSKARKASKLGAIARGLCLNPLSFSLGNGSLLATVTLELHGSYEKELLSLSRASI